MEKDSSLYDQLEKRINQIIQNFSFVQYDRTIPPTDKEQDQIRAMIVLSHAEFEDYFELLAQEILDSGFAHWEDKKEANKNIAALFLYNEHQADFYKQSIDTIGHRAKNNFEKSMENLENIVTELEKGELNLDESVKKFEEGMKIAKQCNNILENAEKKITILLEKNGDFEEKPFDTNNE